MENKDEMIVELLYRYVPREELSRLNLERPILHITEDGVKKYRGDKWYYINKHGEVKETNGANSDPDFTTKRYHSLNAAVTAATKIHQVPSFSLNDINTILKGMDNNKELLEVFRKLAYNK